MRYCVEKRSRLCLYAVVSSICSYINRIVHRQRWSPNKYWNQWKRFRADNSRRAQTIHSRQNSANALLEQVFTTVTGAQAYSHICIYIYECMYMHTTTYIYIHTNLYCMYVHMCKRTPLTFYALSCVVWCCFSRQSVAGKSTHLFIFFAAPVGLFYHHQHNTSAFLHIYTLHFACASSPLASHIYFAYLLCHELLVYGVAHCWLHLFVVLPNLSLSLYRISFIVCSRISYYTLSLTYTSYLLASVTVAQSSVTIFQHTVVLVHA